MTTESKRSKTSGKTNAPLITSLSLFDEPLIEPEPLLLTKVHAQVELTVSAPTENTVQNEPAPLVDLFGEPLVSQAVETSRLEVEIIPAKPPVEMARSQSLYRKWRSQTFDELVGQEAITRTLQNAVSSGKIGHAYLFCGPRGTGKTSSARLLAKAVNCLEPDVTKRPCNQCEPCRSIAEGRAMDLIEIDAASNRGIDEIRDLRDRINYQPNQLRYKLYIIDEVHMLTEPAFNALLKTLEEPPPHAIFVLATTDPQDIPATVVSRCQRFDFQRIGMEASVARLAYICDQENIKYELAALKLVARQSTGSLRDAESLLDQLIVYSDDIIDLKTVQTLLGVMNSEAVAEFANALITNDMAAGLEGINKLVQSGADLKRFNRELVEHLRSLMLVKVSPGAVRNLELSQETLEALHSQSQQIELPYIVNLLKIFSAVDYNLKVSPYVQLPLEIALMEALLPPAADAPGVGAKLHPPTPAPRPAPVQQAAPRPVAPPPMSVPAQYHSASSPAPRLEPQVAARLDEPQVPPPEPKAEPAVDEVDEGVALQLDAVLAVWLQILDQIHVDNKIIHAFLKEARPIAVNGNRVRLNFNYDFHYRKMNANENRLYVEKHFGQVLGQKVVLECYFEDTSKGVASPVATEPEPPRKKKGYGNLAQTFNARPLD